MRLLAIDPGNTESAYVLMDGYKPIPGGFGKIPNEDLAEIVANIKGRAGVDHIAIEMIASYGMPVGREVFDTCVWIGRYTQIAIAHGLPVDSVYRADVKLNLCGSSRAKDGNVRQALIDRFAQHDMKNGKGTKKAPDWFYGFAKDVWAAYGVGVTWMDARKEYGDPGATVTIKEATP